MGLAINHTITDEMLGSAEWRTKLAPELIVACQIRLDFAIGKRRRWVEVSHGKVLKGYGVKSHLKDMDTFLASCDGTETFDRDKFDAVHMGLSNVYAEQVEVYAKADQMLSEGLLVALQTALETAFPGILPIDCYATIPFGFVEDLGEQQLRDRVQGFINGFLAAKHP